MKSISLICGLLLLASSAMAQKATPTPSPDAAKVIERLEAAQNQWVVKKVRMQDLEAQREAINTELTSLTLELSALKTIEAGNTDALSAIEGTAKDITKPLEIKPREDAVGLEPVDAKP